MTRSVMALLIVACAVAGASGAVVAPQDYWHAVLPNTRIPTALLQLLQTDKRATVDSSLWVWVRTPGRGVGVIVNPFNYRYAASETQVRDNTNVVRFFLEQDLAPGSQMKLHFTKTVPNVALLPRSIADSLPFSSAKLPAILSRLSIEPKSIKATIISKTLQTCAEPAVEGETRYCATSLESMVDFATANLGSRNLLALSTEVSKTNSPKQVYTIAPSGVRKLARTQAVACHAQPYPYAVYYCHVTRATKSYRVSLAGKDGTQVEAVVVCHTDTSSWNPKHIAFQLLKVSPGTVPVCHFLPDDHIVWARFV